MTARNRNLTCLAAPWIVASLFCSPVSRTAAKDPKPEKVEIKFVVPPEQVAVAVQTLTTGKTSQAETICFYDTADLNLLNIRKLLLRARQGADGKGETTVKLLSDGEVNVAQPWRDLIGKETAWGNKLAKIEIDQVAGKAGKEAFSLNGDAMGEAISQATGGDQIKALFTPDYQWRFIAEQVQPSLLDWQRLKVFGPIKATVWDDLPAASMAPAGKTYPLEKISVELWDYGSDHQRLLEVSTRVDATAVDAGVTALASLMTDLHLSQGPDSETKTRMVLTHLQSQLTPP